MPLDNKLPIDWKISELGCPWHGFLNKNELLDQPGGASIKGLPNWDQTDGVDGGGVVNLLKVPGLPEVTRTDEEQARDAITGHDWKNYALISSRSIHGQPLGNDIIYIDGNGIPWRIGIVSNINLFDADTWTVTATLKSIFGRFTETPYSAIDRELDSLAVDDTDIDFTTGTHESSNYNQENSWVTDQNSTGSVSFIHHYRSSFQSIIETEEDTDNTRKTGIQLFGVMRVEISGDGSMDRATLGDGITAAVTLYQGRDDCYSIITKDTGKKHHQVDYFSDPWATKYLYSQTPETSDGNPGTNPGCPCPDVITEYRHQMNPAVGTWTEVSVERPVTTYLLRCCFDETDNEQIISAENFSWFGNYNWTYEFVSTYSHIKTYYWDEDDSPCDHCVSGGTLTDVYSGSTTTTTIHDEVAEDVIRLLINGMEVSEFTIAQKETETNWKNGTDTALNKSSTSPELVINGASASEPVETANTLFMIQAYSPQIFGPKWRSSGEAISANRWRVLYKVVCPYGVNSDNDGQVVTVMNGLVLAGTINPADQDCYWYGAGITDTLDAAVNFV